MENNQNIQEISTGTTNNNETKETTNNVVVSNETIDSTESSLTPKERRKKNLRKHLSIIPNSCTSMNLVCGFLSILMCSRGEFLIAGWLILIANIFDILDGRLARLTSVSSQFGAELDSLCDLVSFGAAPAFLIYTRYFTEGTNYIGMFVTVLFVLCGALRLARFNVTPHSHKDVFEGLPIPGGAGILATMIIYEHLYPTFLSIPRVAIPYIVAVTAFLMVSKIEYPAMKKTPKTSKYRLCGVLLVVIAFIVNPPITLFVITWGFGLYGLVFATFRTLWNLGKKLKPNKTTDNA